MPDAEHMHSVTAPLAAMASVGMPSASTMSANSIPVVMPRSREEAPEDSEGSSYSGPPSVVSDSSLSDYCNKRKANQKSTQKVYESDSSNSSFSSEAPRSAKVKVATAWTKLQSE